MPLNRAEARSYLSSPHPRCRNWGHREDDHSYGPCDYVLIPAVECTCNDFQLLDSQPLDVEIPRGASLEDAEGRPEEIDGKLLLTHVIVKCRIKMTKDQREATGRALEHHAARCPVSESVERGITVEWLGEIVEE